MILDNLDLTQRLLAAGMLLLGSSVPFFILLRIILVKRAAERSRKAYAAVGTDSWGNPLAEKSKKK